MRNEAIRKAVDYIVPILTERAEKCPTKQPWATKEDGKTISIKFGLKGPQIAKVYHMASQELGQPIDHRGKRADEMETLITLMNETNGEMTPEIKELFEQKHGHRAKGPVIGAAKRRLGIQTGPGESSSRSDPDLHPIAIDGMKEAMKTYSQYQKLLQEQVNLEARLEEIKRELESYRPIANAFSSFSRTIAEHRDKMKREVSNGGHP